jgi:O-6-methylguanine DNA methyltransferase
VRVGVGSAHISLKKVNFLMSFRSTKQYSDLTPFQKAVYELTYAIPRGKVASYGILSELLGCDGRRGAQAVGNALHKNPFAPEVPCHRILKSGSGKFTLGGFYGSAQSKLDENISRKQAMLHEEGVVFDRSYALLFPDRHVMNVSDFPLSVMEVVVLLLSQRKEKAISSPKKEKQGNLTEVKVVIPPLVAISAPNTRNSMTTGLDVRLACRSGSFAGHTSGLAPGYAQANLVILPSKDNIAYDFLLFCMRNPKPCPLLEVTDLGDPLLKSVATNCDIRTDFPKYIVWRNGERQETLQDVSHLWNSEKKDWIGFLLGCSFSFEELLERNGIPIRHLQEEAISSADTSSSASASGSKKRKKTDTDLSSKPAPSYRAKNPRNVPMYKTNIMSTPAGIFSGPLVVSMRPMTREEAKRASDLTSTFPRVHGKPVFIGEPSKLGIRDISKPDYGDAVTVYPDEVCVFWACGVTPQAAIVRAKPSIAITHAPGHMLVLDCKNEDLTGPSEILI